MGLIENQRINIIFFLIILCFEFSQNIEPIFSYGMKFARAYKLNNGNIIVVGTLGINTYDSSGMNSLYNYSITENPITDTTTGLVTNFAQFSNENNGIGIVIANHILYILNSEGKCLFKYKLEGDLSRTFYYSILPYIYKDNYYHFILGYINSDRKAILQYYFIDLDNEQLIPKINYELNSEDSEKSDVIYDNGISCQFMKHNIYKIVLTCFYQDNLLLHIAASSFKFNENKIERINDLLTSYEDFAFNILSAVSADRKNCLICYINNSGQKGYCAIYNIDINSFNKYANYISSQCDAGINRLTLNYFKETKEYIFSATYYSPEIYIAKFDENFNIIEINSKKEATLYTTNCYTIFFYSIIFISNDYHIIGDFSCNGNIQITTLYSIPDEYKPLEIYSDIIETPLNEDESNSSNQEESKKEDFTNTKFNSDIMYSTDIEDNTNSIINSTDIDDITDIVATTDIEDYSEKDNTTNIYDIIDNNNITYSVVDSIDIINFTHHGDSIDNDDYTNKDDSTNIDDIIGSIVDSKGIDNYFSTNIGYITDIGESTNIVDSIDIGDSTDSGEKKDNDDTINNVDTTDNEESTLNDDKTDSLDDGKVRISNSLDSSELKTYSLISSLINELIFNCTGYKNREGTICSETIPIGYYIIDFINKILGKCHISCKSCEKGPKEDSNNCISCKENFELNDKNNCLYKYNFYFDKQINEIIYLLADQFCPEKIPYEIVETKECVETCSNEELINKKCIINYFSDNNLNLITDKLKTIIKEVTDSNYDVIVNGNNIIYEISSSSSSNDYSNVSRIDFGECQNILKNHYSIDYLLIFKMDIKLNESYPTVVEYEVYSPKTKEKLNLTLCESSQIDVYIPVNLDNNTYTYNIYNEISKIGYDILDKDNSFYNDICTPFTSDDGTDITLKDRQSTYYNNSITLCESSCTYKFYNTTNGKAKCQCQIKKEISEIKTISYDKMDIKNFLDIKTFSNIGLIKCYKLTFSKVGLNKNYGNIILLYNIGIFISFFILYEINQKKLVSRILRLVLLSIGIKNPPKKKCVDFHFVKKNSRKSLNLISRNNQQSQTIRDLIDSKHSINLKKSNKKMSFQIKNLNDLNLIQNENYLIDNKTSRLKKKNHTNKIWKKPDLSLNSYKNEEKSNHHHIKKDEINSELHHCHHEKDKGTSNNYFQHYNDKNKEYSDFYHTHNHEIEIKYNDYELNNLEYMEAISLDKRGYLEYYWSLLKTKHIVLSIFLASNDYNLIIIKLSLFIFSFCLYFTVNALFFTDKTMHKIYASKGLFNIIVQLPQILYSTLISAFINMITKKLALSEKDILNIKTIKNKGKALEKSSEIYRYLMIKFNIFFGVSMLLLAFFWYYITTFCAVYKNTQKTLIINTLTCFLMSLLYPFASNLLPGIFRIPALKSEKKDEKFIYNIGNIIALI